MQSATAESPADFRGSSDESELTRPAEKMECENGDFELFSHFLFSLIHPNTSFFFHEVTFGGLFWVTFDRDVYYSLSIWIDVLYFSKINKRLKCQNLADFSEL